MVVVFNNRRTASGVLKTQAPPAPPQTALTEPPAVVQQPQPAKARQVTLPVEIDAPEAPYRQKRYKQKPLSDVITRGIRADGFGLFCCGNCKWFKRLAPTVDGPKNREFLANGCKSVGVKESAMPCILNQHGYGHFAPAVMSEKVKESNIDHLEADELLLLSWLVKKRLSRIYTKGGFKPGQRVKFDLNGELHRGVVIETNRRRLRVLNDVGGIVSLDLKDVDNENEKPGKKPRNRR